MWNHFKRLQAYIGLIGVGYRRTQITSQAVKVQERIHHTEVTKGSAPPAHVWGAPVTRATGVAHNASRSRESILDQHRKLAGEKVPKRSSEQVVAGLVVLAAPQTFINGRIGEGSRLQSKLYGAWRAVAGPCLQGWGPKSYLVVE